MKIFRAEKLLNEAVKTGFLCSEIKFFQPKLPIFIYNKPY